MGVKETTASLNWLDLSNIIIYYHCDGSNSTCFVWIDVGCSYKRGKEPSGHVCGCGRAAYACYPFFYSVQH